ncbi:MAG: hypothetical protein EXR28_11905 [Betaproteobacteria bacterium]|nr:hypothetical protein [Betaproteobacteria bacterium]
MHLRPGAGAGAVRTGPARANGKITNRRALGQIIAGTPTGAGRGAFFAGDGFSLDQAVEDGVRESSGKSPFAVLVLNAEISKLGIHGATSEVTAVVLKAGKSGGTLYVCDRDVKRQGFTAHEFLPGVQAVRGFSKAEAQSAAAGSKQAGAAPSAPMQRIRSICSE